MATLSIHNWLMSSGDSKTRFENEVLGSSNKFMPQICAQQSDDDAAHEDALTMRDSLCNFFVKENPLFWQRNFI